MLISKLACQSFQQKTIISLKKKKKQKQKQKQKTKNYHNRLFTMHLSSLRLLKGIALGESVRAK